MITRIQSLRLYLREFQRSLGRRLSVADVELLGPIERHRRLGRCSPWIVHDHPDRPGSLPLLRKYLQWVIDYTGVDYPEILFEPPPEHPDSYRGCNFDHIVFTRCRFTLHRDRYDRCTRVFIPQLSPGRLFILHFLCTRPPWVCNETNTSRRERAAPTEEDTKLTLRGLLPGPYRSMAQPVAPPPSGNSVAPSLGALESLRSLKSPTSLISLSLVRMAGALRKAGESGCIAAASRSGSV